MEEKTYTITLADGTIIDNLRLNGNNYISSREIVESAFLDNCSPVVISDGENEEFHENMELANISNYNGEYWFVLRDLSKNELERIKMQADIEYIAMMSDIEL